MLVKKTQNKPNKKTPTTSCMYGYLKHGNEGNRMSFQQIQILPFTKKKN